MELWELQAILEIELEKPEERQDKELIKQISFLLYGSEEAFKER